MLYQLCCLCLKVFGYGEVCRLIRWQDEVRIGEVGSGGSGYLDRDLDARTARVVQADYPRAVQCSWARDLADVALYGRRMGHKVKRRGFESRALRDRSCVLAR